MPRPLLVSSESNPRVKLARALLRGSAGRRAAGLFAAEGIQIATRALEAPGWHIDQLIVSSGEPGEDRPGESPSSVIDDLRARADQRHVPVTWVTAPVFLHITQRQMPHGAVVIGRRRAWSLDDLPGDVPALVLERPSAPGNIGTIVRTCEAAALGGIVLVGDHADHLSPTALRSSMGSVFGVPVAETSRDELVEWARRSGRALLGTSGAAAQSLWEADLPARSAVVFGNEGAGMSPELQRQCDAMLRIPFSPAVDSLNLSSAAAVVAFEYRRRVPLP